MFETDFWKDADRRKMWDDIVPGEPRKTIPYVLTLDAIHRYCRSAGEDNPLYFDEAYARTRPADPRCASVTASRTDPAAWTCRGRRGGRWCRYQEM
jgi:hypothetical protein